MTLGEKLRQARLEAGLSQRKLCGGEITRNMLSQIENGSAHPSMSTLQYLARQLGKPVSFFLEEEAEVSANRGCMDAAWEKYLKSDAAGALAALSDYQGPDPIYDRELSLLRPLVLLSLAETALQEGRLPYAAKLLDQVTVAPWLPELRVRRAGLLSKMGVIIRADSLPEPDEWLMLYAAASLSDGDADRAARFLDACKIRNASWQLLRGKAAVAAGDYAIAVGWLKQAETEFPESTIPLLEQAFRELGDYRSAYEYACKARQK